MHSEKVALAERTNPDHSRDLATVMKGAGVFIGVSKAGLVSQDMVRSMAPKAIVFAMANPIPEITEEEARRGAATMTKRLPPINSTMLVFLTFPRRAGRSELTCSSCRVPWPIVPMEWQSISSLPF
jgi:hypothetical protein